MDWNAFCASRVVIRCIQWAKTSCYILFFEWLEIEWISYETNSHIWDTKLGLFLQLKVWMSEVVFYSGSKILPIENNEQGVFLTALVRNTTSQKQIRNNSLKQGMGDKLVIRSVKATWQRQPKQVYLYRNSHRRSHRWIRTHALWIGGVELFHTFMVIPLPPQKKNPFGK